MSGLGIARETTVGREDVIINFIYLIVVGYAPE